MLSKEEFDVFWLENYARFLRTAKYLLNKYSLTSVEVTDIVNDVYVKIVAKESWKVIDLERYPCAYVIQIINYTVLDLCRKKVKEPIHWLVKPANNEDFTDDSMVDLQAASENTFTESVTMADDLISHLPKITENCDQRTLRCIQLVFIEGLTQNQIAAMLNIDRTTISKLLTRFKDEFVQCYLNNMFGEPQLSAYQRELLYYRYKPSPPFAELAKRYFAEQMAVDPELLEAIVEIIKTDMNKAMECVYRDLFVAESVS